MDSRAKELRKQMMKHGGLTEDTFSGEDLYPEDIASMENIVYGPDPYFNAMDIYRPKDRDGEKLPVIVSVHGGAWIAGDKIGYRAYCSTLAREGFAVLSINYHLTPEAQFPVPLMDINLVFVWLMEHAEEFLFDTERVFGVGDSAGGHLISLYALLLTNDKYAERFDFKRPEGLVIRALGLNCGMFVFRPEDRVSDADVYEIMDYYLPGGATEENLYLITPTHFLNESFPPSFLMSGVGDFLLPQQYLMQKALADKFVPFEFHFYSCGETQLGHVFHINVTLDVSRKANAEECAFFKKFF